MAYASIDDFKVTRGEDETVRLTNLDEPGAETVNEVTLQSALDKAGAEIDGYLAVRYTVPVTPTPEILVKYEIIIARKDLDRYTRSKYVQDDYEHVIASLKRMSRGEEALVSGTGEDAEIISQNEDSKAVTYGSVGFGHSPRTFTHSNLRTYGRNLR